MTYPTFLILLLVSSTMTGLITEAVKKVLDEAEKTYHANMLAGIIAVVVSAALSVGYTIIAGLAWSSQLIVILVALVVLSWLCAMLGYDKVVQAISQFQIGDDSDGD